MEVLKVPIRPSTVSGDFQVPVVLLFIMSNNFVLSSQLSGHHIQSSSLPQRLLDHHIIKSSHSFLPSIKFITLPHQAQRPSLYHKTNLNNSLLSLLISLYTTCHPQPTPSLIVPRWVMTASTSRSLRRLRAVFNTEPWPGGKLALLSSPK
jgi:hypothetical protein